MADDEVLSGVGDIYDEESFVCKVDYQLTKSHDPDEGAARTVGSISIHPNAGNKVSDLGELFHRYNQKVLTLRLSDGRCQDFRIRDNSGTIQGTGTIYL